MSYLNRFYWYFYWYTIAAATVLDDWLHRGTEKVDRYRGLLTIRLLATLVRSSYGYAWWFVETLIIPVRTVFFCVGSLVVLEMLLVPK
jgi:ABC-type multidrug transport system permease subunit